MNTVEKIDKQIADLREQKESIRSRRKIKCSHCEKHTPLAKATLVVDNWHVPPRGCTGGDYWKLNEYWYICPKCGERSRAYISSHMKDYRTDKLKPEYEKAPEVVLFKFIEEHRKYFGEVLESYDDGHLTLDELRVKNKKREERRLNRGW